MTTQTLANQATTRPVTPLTLKVLTGLLFIWMLLIGTFKLIGTLPTLVATFQTMHYLPIMPFIGILEIAGGIGLLIPRLRIWAALGLFLLFFGGLASHLASATYLPMVPLSVVAMLMAVCVIHFDGRLHIGHTHQ